MAAPLGFSSMLLGPMVCLPAAQPPIKIPRQRLVIFRKRAFPAKAAILSADRFRLRYDAQFFNLFNHPSFDAPNNNISLDSCFGPNLQTSPANGCQWNGTIPAVAPSTTAFGDKTAPFGSGIIQGTLGSPRLI